MCIVVDTNSLAPVFNEGCSEHVEFRPVKDWIFSGNGFLVYGGSRYKKELQRAGYRYLRLVRQMKDGGYAIAIKDSEVDQREQEVVNETQGTNCDDQHIIALLGVSRCPLLCSQDKRSYGYVKNRNLYPNRLPIVRIYSSSRNGDLLVPMKPDILRNLG